MPVKSKQCLSLIRHSPCYSYNQDMLDATLRKHTHITCIRHQPLLQTIGVKDEPNIVFIWKSQWTSQNWTKNVFRHMIGQIRHEINQNMLWYELPALPEHLSSPSVFSGVRVTRSLVLCVMFCRSLFVLLFFFFWSLCCLFFFDLWIMITPLVSSNSS